MATSVRQRTTDRGPAGPVDPSCPHTIPEWGKLPVPGEYEQEGGLNCSCSLSGGQSPVPRDQPWPEKFFGLHTGRARPTLHVPGAGRPSTLCPRPAAGLFYRPFHKSGGSILKGHYWSHIAFPFTLNGRDNNMTPFLLVRQSCSLNGQVVGLGAGGRNGDCRRPGL